MAEKISMISAAQDFFSRQPYGRKIEISEFKALTRQDRAELREMLIAEGYDIAELPPVVTS